MKKRSRNQKTFKFDDEDGEDDDEDSTGQYAFYSQVAFRGKIGGCVAGVVWVPDVCCLGTRRV